MTKEKIIEVLEMTEKIIEVIEMTRKKLLDELIVLNAKHDAVLQFIAELNVLIETARENDDA